MREVATRTTTDGEGSRDEDGGRLIRSALTRTTSARMTLPRMAMMRTGQEGRHNEKGVRVRRAAAVITGEESRCDEDSHEDGSNENGAHGQGGRLRRGWARRTARRRQRTGDKSCRDKDGGRVRRMAMTRTAATRMGEEDGHEEDSGWVRRASAARTVVE
jgi:hypothetical protein